MGESKGEERKRLKDSRLNTPQLDQSAIATFGITRSLSIFKDSQDQAQKKSRGPPTHAHQCNWIFNIPEDSFEMQRA